MVCAEAAAQKATAPILPRLPSGRRTKSVPPPHLICSNLIGWTTAHTRSSHHSGLAHSPQTGGDSWQWFAGAGFCLSIDRLAQGGLREGERGHPRCRPLVYIYIL
jgi:hypothetical protein